MPNHGKKPVSDAVAVFRETAKGMGRQSMRPHEAYEDELEERQQKIRLAPAACQ